MPLAAGKRELLEETGYTAKRWKRAFFFYPSPGFLEETMTVFLARGLKPGTAQPEDDERIEHDSGSAVASACKLIMSGKIRDGKTIAGVLWFRTSARRSRGLAAIIAPFRIAARYRNRCLGVECTKCWHTRGSLRLTTHVYSVDNTTNFLHNWIRQFNRREFRSASAHMED